MGDDPAVEVTAEPCPAGVGVVDEDAAAVADDDAAESVGDSVRESSPEHPAVMLSTSEPRTTHAR